MERLHALHKSSCHLCSLLIGRLNLSEAMNKWSLWEMICLAFCKVFTTFLGHFKVTAHNCFALLCLRIGIAFPSRKWKSYFINLLL